MSTNIPPPAAPIRHITTNTPSGKSTFSSLSPTLPDHADLGGALQHLVYTAPPNPSLTGETDLTTYKSTYPDTTKYNLVRSDAGANVWYIDVPPNSSSPMHRTVSIDFVVFLQGEIELELDGGEKRVVKAGEMVVQRSTMHAWHNRSEKEWVRMVAFMTKCEEVEVEGGRKLGLEFLH